MSRRFDPMLASSGRPRGALDGWAAEPKLDGWRAIATAVDGRVIVRTRRGNDVTAAVPELAGLAAEDAVLDGELVIGAGRLNDFYGLAGRLAGRRRDGSAARVTFAAFDVLRVDDQLLVDKPYEVRRDALEALDLTGAYVVVPRFAGTDADDLLAACEQQGMEGVMLKRLGSRYQPGERSRDWRKVKCSAWAEHLRRRVGERGPDGSR